MPDLTEQQRQAVCCDAREILVAAGAGSGKTHVLVERYVDVLRRNPRLSIGALVAVTFTRKAANEMRTRLKNRLKELVQTSQDEEKERWNSCLSQIDAAKIGTIHALCESIIKAFPVDAGIDPQFELLDDIAQAELLKDCVDQSMRQAITETADEHELFLEFDLQEIRRCLVAAMKSSLQFNQSILSLNTDDPQAFRRHAQAIMSVVQRRKLLALPDQSGWKESVQYLLAHPWPDQASPLEQYRLTALNLVGAIDGLGGNSLEQPGPDAGSVWICLEQVAEMKPRTSGGNSDEAKSLRQAIKVIRELAQETVEKVPTLNEEDDRAFATAGAFVRLANRAQKIYQCAKESSLLADYNDLIWFALRALERPNSAARRHYNSYIHEILIDEFQDTNKLQSTLISLLAGESTTLFLIGDDKQSIYKFQGADMLAFTQWRERVRQSQNGALLTLNHSFRSHERVLSFINTLFASLMGEQRSPYDATFERLHAARPMESNEPRVELIEFLVEEDEDGNRPDPRLHEARLVASWVKGSIESGLQPLSVADKNGERRAATFGDFAVLVQRNGDFANLEAAFTEQSIPYVTFGGKGFLQRQEIYDMENLLRFVDQPLDDHSLLGVLRSPLFSVSDDLIHLVATARRRQTSLWQALNIVAQSNYPGLEQLRSVTAQLRRFIESAARMPVPAFLRQVMQFTCFDLTLLALPNGKQRSRNLWKLIELAGQHEELTAGEFARSLELMREFGVQQSDAPLDANDAIKIMTVHASKGLEFPIVVLPVLDVPANSKNGRVIYNREYGIAFNTARSEEQDKPAWFATASTIENDMEIAEKKRLFYVATTRARDYLAVFLNQESRRQPSFATWLNQELAGPAGYMERGTEASASGGLSAIAELISFKKAEAVGGAGAGAEEAGWQSAGSIPDSSQQDSSQPASADWPLFHTQRQEPLRPLSRYDLMFLEDMSVPEVAHSDWQARLTAADSTAAVPEQRKLGTFFHSLMEFLPEDGSEPSQELIESIAFTHALCPDSSVHDQLIDDGRQLLSLFLTSDLRARLSTCQKHFHELPYLCEEDEFHVKRPDLLFLDQNGQWHIVDYKTDQIDESKLELHLSKHRQQLDEYAQDLKRIVGLPCQKWIYFARTGALTPV